MRTIDTYRQILIIGGGPAGYIAALRASQLGAKVTLIESSKLGGTCLNRGCIPTKSLLESTRVFELVKTAGTFGISIGSADIDYSKVILRKDMVVKQLSAGVGYLLKNSGVTIMEGNARFLSKDEIEVTQQNGEKQRFTAQKFIIASGSIPVIPPIKGIEYDTCMTSEKALEMTRLPKTMAIIGGGVVGVELATVFASLGTKVSIVEMMPQLIPSVDREVADILKSNMRRNGIAIYLNSKVAAVRDSFEGKIIEVINEQGDHSTVVSEKILISAGRKSNTENLGLENIGVKIERGCIIVNEKMETSIPDIYAAGDVTGGILLAHVASEEGKVAAENAVGLNSSMDYNIVPGCIFTRPEIGTVGLSEEQAKLAGYSVKIGRFPFRANGKALVKNEAEGFVKIIANAKDDRILGVHIAGPDAAELIHECVLGIKLHATIKDIAETIHAHPTLSEAILEAALDVNGSALNIPGRK